jgi:cell division protein FtsI (penicillin-binding protein 3)
MLDAVDKRRFTVFAVVTALVLALVVGQYAAIMLFGGGESTIERPRSAAVERGSIFDRNGEVLAVQTRMNTVSVWKPRLENSEEAARLLAPILGKNELDLRDIMEDEGSDFAYLQRKIGTTAGEKVRSLIEADLVPGVYLENEYGRSYPAKSLAASVIGFTDIDNRGLAGVEYVYDEQLGPPESASPSAYGNDLYLTLDSQIQFFAEEAARTAYEVNDADSVMLMVMDAQTGEYLAWASYPSFDPNAFWEYEGDDFVNRPLTYSYEPGSVFKLFSLAAFLDQGGISPFSVFYCDGQYERETFDGSLITIRDLGVHNEVYVADIIKYSCNSGAAYASETIGRQQFHDVLVRFGFGRRTGLGLPGESAGILREPDQWSLRSKPTIAIGQEINVSAVQMMAAATALTNDGEMLQPSIVARITAPDGEVLQTRESTPGRRVVSADTARTILGMMEGATQDGGTGIYSAIPGVRVGTKTGTAEKLDPATGTYSDEAFVASSLSILPLDNPRLILYGVIDYPKGESIYGGNIAAPMVREVAELAIPYLGIPRSSDLEIVRDPVIELTPLTEIRVGDTMPNVRGLSKREILPLFEREDLIVSVSGEGWVVSQSPEPGVVLTPGTEIRLVLE